VDVVATAQGEGAEGRRRRRLGDEQERRREDGGPADAAGDDHYQRCPFGIGAEAVVGADHRCPSVQRWPRGTMENATARTTARTMRFTGCHLSV
jgi:hypothetical protein